MVKEWKSKRQLSLLVAFALSAGGGQLFFSHAHAADVTGGNVLVDSGHPAPSPIVAGNAHDIPGATDNRNVTGNKLTIDGASPSNSYGGYTLGTGQATNNTLIFKNITSTLCDYGYAGYTAHGSAINNTAVLTNSTATTSLYLSLIHI